MQTFAGNFLKDNISGNQIGCVSVETNVKKKAI